MKLAYSEVDLEKMKQSCKRLRDKAIICFLFLTRCRISELYGANIEDLDFDHKKLSVLGKGNKTRTIYLTDVSIHSLQKYLEERHDEDKALFVTRSHSGRVSQGGIRALLKRLEKVCGVENCHPHRFRHTCCSKLLARGMAIQDVAMILGHSSIGTTMIYNNSTEHAIRARYEQYAV